MAFHASLMRSFDRSSVLKLKGPCQTKSCWAAGNGIVSMTGLASTSGAEEGKGSVCHVRVNAHHTSNQTFTRQDVSLVSISDFKLLKCNSGEQVEFYSATALPRTDDCCVEWGFKRIRTKLLARTQQKKKKYIYIYIDLSMIYMCTTIVWLHS